MIVCYYLMPVTADQITLNCMWAYLHLCGVMYGTVTIGITYTLWDVIYSQIIRKRGSVVSYSCKATLNANIIVLAVDRINRFCRLTVENKRIFIAFATRGGYLVTFCNPFDGVLILCCVQSTSHRLLSSKCCFYYSFG